MKIKKVFQGSVTSSSRHVSNTSEGQKITESSTITVEGITERVARTLPSILDVDGLYPIGTKFTLTLEEV